MLLRTKLGLILVGVVALSALIDGGIQRRVIYPGFEELERREAKNDLARVVQALENEVEHLDRLCHDWSAWDDTFQFIETRDQAYLDANLTPTTLSNAELFLVYHVARDGTVVSSVFNQELAGDPPCAVPDCPPERRDPGHALHRVKDKDDRLTGFLATPRGLTLVSSRSIVPSDESGTPNGSLLMARLLDRARVQKLLEQTKVQFRIVPVAPGLQYEAGQSQALAELTAGAAEVIQATSLETLELRSLVRDVHGVPVGMVEASVPREITAGGRGVLDYALLSTLLAATVVLIVLLCLLQGVVVAPLDALAKHAVRIGDGRVVDVHLSSRRKDEIGILSNALDVMVDKLAESRARIVKSAHLAGMSEVATEVLHDVGNVLNSANVSAEQIKSRLEASRTPDVARIASLFRAGGDDLGRFFAEDPRARQIPAFVELLGQALEEERRGLGEESHALSQSIEHMRELVMHQQENATHAALLEPVVLSEQVELALRISKDALDGEIRFERRFGAVPTIEASKHRLLQVLVNLLRNARQSVHAAGGAEKHIEIVIACSPSGGQVTIEVRDNGLGIAPENLTKMFAHGYTTKPDGHGFGLHGSANAAREMNGSLTGRSNGPEAGATFVLELPLASTVLAA